MIASWKIIVKSFKNTRATLAFFTIPYFVISFISGQLSLLLAAFFIWLYKNIDAKPVLSGVFIALLTVKPHLGILIPLFLILTCRWKVFASAAITSVIFIGSSMLIQGMEVWQTYLNEGPGNQLQVLGSGSYSIVDGLMHSVYMNMIVVGADVRLATIVHIIFALGVVVWFCLMVWNGKDHFIQYAAFIVATFMISPYMMSYDFFIIVWVLIMLAYRHKFNQLHKIIFKLVMILPALSVAMSYLGIPGSALVIISLAVWLWTVMKTEVGKTQGKTGSDPLYAR